MKLSNSIGIAFVIVWVAMLLFILITITHAQSAKPLTLQDLVQMQKAGFDD
jgi:hypothetical protein